ELIGEHSGQNMADAVWETMKIYHLESKVIAIMADNATNNDTMMEALESLCLEVGIVFSVEMARMCCVPHTVHLSALEVSLFLSDSSHSTGLTLYDRY
ncbi:hypothetical protein BV25DRAFT_1803021, partial [Artomyces pyxidatus]